MMYRGIEELHGTSGTYKQIIHVHSDGRFERAYVTAYADIPDSCKLWDYGEDYHDADEIFVWGKYETTTDRMGWGKPEDLVKSMNARETGIVFKPFDKIPAP